MSEPTHSITATEGRAKRFSKSAIAKKYFNQSTLMLVSLALPMFLYKIVFHYIPMSGVVLAFKSFRFDRGIWSSPWVGLANFRFFFESPDAWRTARNTLGYSAVFIVIGTVSALFIAVLLYELNNRRLVKYTQTTMLLPHFMSWVMVAFIAYGFLNYESGIINMFRARLGLDPINWYTTKPPWVLIIPLANTWKHIGMSSLIYYASLMGIDPSYYEAARVEGANRFQIAVHVTLPFLYPMVIMLSILSVGRIFNADFGLFYQLPKGSTILLPVTDVIETYVFRALREGQNIGMATAVDLYKSTIGLILVIATNSFVKRVRPENTLF